MTIAQGHFIQCVRILLQAIVCGELGWRQIDCPEVSRCGIRGKTQGMFDNIYLYKLRIRQPHLALKPRGDVSNNAKRVSVAPKRHFYPHRTFLKKNHSTPPQPDLGGGGGSSCIPEQHVGGSDDHVMHSKVAITFYTVFLYCLRCTPRGPVGGGGCIDIV